MEVTAKAKFVKISPKKVKPLLKDIKGKTTTEVLEALKYSPHKAGGFLYKLISSAVANAYNNYNLNKDNLKIKKITADSGPTFKRRWLRSRGSSDVILKRTAHLSVVLEEVLPSSKKAVKSQKLQDVKPSTKSPATKTEDADKKDSKSADIDKSSPKQKLDIKKIFRRTTNK